MCKKPKKNSMVPSGVQKTACFMTLLSVINILEPREYMEVLDYWTEYSIECHWRQLVKECQLMSVTGKSEEIEETGKSDDLPPFTEIYHGQNDIPFPG